MSYSSQMLQAATSGQRYQNSIYFINRGSVLVRLQSHVFYMVCSYEMVVHAFQHPLNIAETDNVCVNCSRV